MALLDDVRLAVRTASTKTDDEIQLWIDAAVADMKRVGIKAEMLDTTALDALPKAAVVCYVKAHYGYDIDERAQFGEDYRSIVISLLNSDANIASGENDG